MTQKLRPDVDEYFLKIAKVVGERSTCVRRQIGAIAVKDKQILATGYNGAPAGIPDCLELGCLRDQMNIPSGSPHEVCRSVHAEMNVIIQAAKHGVNLHGATIYCTTAPCALCARMLVNMGIKRYVCYVDYPNKEAYSLFEKSGIKLEILPEPTFDPKVVGEQVLCVPKNVFERSGDFTGFKKYDPDFYKNLLFNVRYVYRDDAETNIEWKQIIPYVIVHHKDKYLILKRLPRSGEKRLHNAYTLGVGGHINPTDSTSDAEGADVIERGMYRELDEEIKVEGLNEVNLVGFIYDESQEVSKHHIGFVYETELSSENVEVLEKDKLEPYWVDLKEIPKYLDGKEKWAEIVYDEYISKQKSHAGAK